MTSEITARQDLDSQYSSDEVVVPSAKALGKRRVVEDEFEESESLRDPLDYRHC